MKSIVNMKSHPVHPALVAFPIAFFVGSFLSDLAGYFLNIPDLWRTGYWLQISGVGFGLIAGFTGFLDFLVTVPPNSTGKKRAAKHGIVNFIVILIFGFNWFYRQGADASPFAVLGLDIAGVTLISIGGWLGGTLVYRNQIGVDHRYANAGKWKEEFLKASDGTVKAADSDELEVNQMKLLRIDDKRIVLARTENNFVAFDDHCTHRGGSLADGAMICGTVQCPWHGSQFDVTTGEVKAGPAKEKIKTYKVYKRDGNVFLEL